MLVISFLSGVRLEDGTKLLVEPFTYINIGIMSFIIIFLGINAFIGLKNLSTVDNKTSMFIQKKEFNEGITYATNLRNKSCFTQTFKACTLYIGYLNMFADNKGEAYNVLSYFFKNRIGSYLDFFAIYLLYTVCIILKKDEDIKLIQEKYKTLLVKYKRRMNKDAVLFKYKTLIDNLISNSIEEGLEALVKLDCKLVTNYLDSKK